MKLEVYWSFSPTQKDKEYSKTARKTWAGWGAHTEAAQFQRVTSMCEGATTFYTGFEVWMLASHLDL